VLDIYQRCETRDEIDEAFDEFGAELDSAAAGSVRGELRRSLLERFDGDVRARLEERGRLDSSDRARLDRDVEALVLGAAAKVELDDSGTGYHVEHDVEISGAVSSEQAPGHVCFGAHGTGESLGARHPLVRTLVTNSLSHVDADVLHDVAVTPGARLARWRGARGFWRIYLATSEGHRSAIEVVHVAVWGDTGTALDPEEAIELAEAARIHRGISPLQPGATAIAALDVQASAASRAIESAARRDGEDLIAREDRRHVRFDGDCEAEGRRHLDRARRAIERAERRLEDSPSSDRSVLELFRGQLRHEEELLGEDRVRRRRERDQALSAISGRLTTRVELRPLLTARFWIV